ncbi:ras-like protein RAS2 [Dysidea avara]|uniref:ras-like protein RAS2 n=1 Tax=Dysidea avara TaxID=196820 RepID=UPI003329A816
MDEYKLVVVGDSKVGKTTLTITFVEEFGSIVEDSYLKKCVVDDKLASLSILETTGEEDFDCTAVLYMHAGEGFLLVYSITDRNSFEEIPKLHKQICRVKDSDEFPVILVGNKADLENERVVSYSEGENLAAQMKMKYVESSAKHKVHVDKAFHDLVREIRRSKKP